MRRSLPSVETDASGNSIIALELEWLAPIDDTERICGGAQADIGDIPGDASKNLVSTRVERQNWHDDLELILAIANRSTSTSRVKLIADRLLTSTSRSSYDSDSKAHQPAER